MTDPRYCVLHSFSTRQNTLSIKNNNKKQKQNKKTQVYSAVNNIENASAPHPLSLPPPPSLSLLPSPFLSVSVCVCVNTNIENTFSASVPVEALAKAGMFSVIIIIEHSLSFPRLVDRQRKVKKQLSVNLTTWQARSLTSHHGGSYQISLPYDLQDFSASTSHFSPINLPETLARAGWPSLQYEKWLCCPLSALSVYRFVWSMIRQSGPP